MASIMTGAAGLRQRQREANLYMQQHPNITAKSLNALAFGGLIALPLLVGFIIYVGATRPAEGKYGYQS